jgi:integrase
MADKNQELWDNFLGSIRSEATKKQYASIMKIFLKFCGFTQWTQLAKLDRKALQQRIINYTQAKKKNGDTAHTSNVHMSAIRHFCEYNDLPPLNWKILRSYSGEHVKSIKDRAYTIEEIRKMMEFTDLRGKCIILLAASTGMRIGAIPDLKMKHLTPIQNFYRITVYENSNEEYWTCCTPECRMHLDQYFEYRKRSGEEMKPDSPVLREQFNAEDKNTISKPKQIAKFTIAAIMRNLVIKVGIRTPSEDKQQRQSIMLMHGYRKWYNTQMVNSGVSNLIKEMLIGHKTIGGLEGSYFRPKDEEIISQYLKAVDNLTIFTENKLKQELEEVKKKVSREGQLEEQLQQTQKQLERMQLWQQQMMEGWQKEKHPDWSEEQWDKYWDSIHPQP